MRIPTGLPGEQGSFFLIQEDDLSYRTTIRLSGGGLRTRLRFVLLG